MPAPTTNKRSFQERHRNLPYQKENPILSPSESRRAGNGRQNRHQNRKQPAMTIHKVAIGKFPLNAIMQAIQPDIRLQTGNKIRYTILDAHLFLLFSQTGYRSLVTGNLLIHFDQDFRPDRQVNIYTRTKLDKPHLFVHMALITDFGIVTIRRANAPAIWRANTSTRYGL